MPNNELNLIIPFTQKDNKKIKKLLAGENKTITFNNVIPMPPTLNFMFGGTQDEFDIADKLYKQYYHFRVINFPRSSEKEHVKKEYFETLKKILTECGEMPRSITVTTLQDMLDSIYEKGRVNDIANLNLDNGKNLQDYLRAINRMFFGSYDWYEWSNIHWGTKWDAYNSDLDYLNFDSAWDIPLPIYKSLFAEHKCNFAVLHRTEYDGSVRLIYFSNAEPTGIIIEKKYLTKFYDGDGKKRLTTLKKMVTLNLSKLGYDMDIVEHALNSFGKKTEE